MAEVAKQQEDTERLKKRMYKENEGKTEKKAHQPNSHNYCYQFWC